MMMRRWGTIVLTLLVAGVGVGIFVYSGQPMNAASDTAQRWLEALCADDWPVLYQTSLIPEGMTFEAFAAQAQDYSLSGELPRPCTAQVNLNLIRSAPVPPGYTDRVRAVRYLPSTFVYDLNGRAVELTLWVYETGVDAWLVKPPFLGPTFQRPVPPGESIGAVDHNGVVTGFLRVLGPALVYEDENQFLVGVLLNIQTLSRAWNHYEASLFLNQRRAREVFLGELPIELQADFLPANGSYVPQNADFNGRVWFRADSLSAPAVLALSPRPAELGASAAVFLAVDLGELQIEGAGFSPFELVRVLDPAGDSLRFEVVIAARPIGETMIQCDRLVLHLDSDAWLTPSLCGFTPELHRLVLLPDERLRAEIEFIDSRLLSERPVRLTYRDASELSFRRLVLWEAD